MPVGADTTAVRVTLEVAGGETREFDVTDETYADLLSELDLSPNAVAVLVDGRPVPEDAPVDAEHARVVRLIEGG